MIIKYPVIKKIPSISKEVIKDIEIYCALGCLKNEFDKTGCWDHLSLIPQLGDITTGRRFRKTRMDYVMLQLYLHSLCKKYLPSRELEYSYGAYLSGKDLGFSEDIRLPDGKRPSVADAVQILVTVTNIGHFKRSFTESRAMLLWLREDHQNAEKFLSMFKLSEIRAAAEKIIAEENYHRFHLLNSALLLQCCDRNNPGVRLAERVLIAYLDEDSCSEKVRFSIELYRAVREIAIVGYDLQTASFPFLLTLQDEKAMAGLLRERLSTFNDREPAITLLSSMMKFLNDTLYTSKLQVFKEYKWARYLSRRFSIPLDLLSERDYLQRFLDGDTFTETGYAPRSAAYSAPVLKITVAPGIAETLMKKLDSIQFVEAAWYGRRNNLRTVLIQIKNNCSHPAYTALKIMRTTTTELSKAGGEEDYHSQYLLTVKYFISYLLRETRLLIEPTVTDDKHCVAVIRGAANRKKHLKAILENPATTDEDKIHEAECMLDYLCRDGKNDTAYLIPASIKAVDEKNQYKCEFDGMIVFPYREEEQVVFLEAKNGRNGKAKKCLKDRLNKLDLKYNPDAFEDLHHDCCCRYTVSRRPEPA